MNWTYNPTGDDLPINIKEIIDKLPEDLFYPHIRRKVVPIAPIPQNTTPNPTSVVEPVVQEDTKREEIRLQSELQVKQEVEKMEEELREKNGLISEKKLEDEKLKESELLELENQMNFRMIEKFISEQLETPTTSLLQEFYDPKEDDRTTLLVLHHFEKTGTFLHQKREVIDEELALREYNIKRERDLNEKPLISIEIPNDLPKDPISLLRALESLEADQKRDLEGLDREMKKNHLRVLMSLQDRPEIQKNPEWKEYTDLHFVKPTEKQVFQRIHKPYDPTADPVIAPIQQAESLNEVERRKFQVENLIVAEDLDKKWLRSKL
jgi:hypothetical protein